MESENFLIGTRRHEQLVRQLPCAVSRKFPVTIHHTHGGSVKDHGWHVGMAQRQNPFLIIPLHFDWHVGKYGIDAGVGVESWESTWGTQIEHLEYVDEEMKSRFGYPTSIFELARAYQNRGLPQPVMPKDLDLDSKE